MLPMRSQYAAYVYSAGLFTVATAILVFILFQPMSPTYYRVMDAIDGNGTLRRSKFIRPQLTEGNINSTFKPSSTLEHNDGILDIEQYVPPMYELEKKLRIITAVSDNHVLEVKPLIATVQKFMPKTTIIVYDLGLSGMKKKELSQLCNVEIRPFHFGRYPPHVKNLHTYAFKPILINMSLYEFGVIDYGDASVRFKSSVFDLLPVSLKHHGYMTRIHRFNITPGIHHQHNHTMPILYKTLGVNMTEYVRSPDSALHVIAGQQLYVNSSYIHEKLLQPWVRCALEKECIAPKGSNLGNHRFDSSALNLLIYRNMRGEWTPENNDNEAFNANQYVKREDRKSSTPKKCG